MSALVPGLRIQNFDSLREVAGTLGCFVRDEDGKICLLSCNHVIAERFVGRSTGGKVGDRIIDFDRLHPSGSNASACAIGKLTKWTELKLDRCAKHVSEPDYADAAIARLTDGCTSSYDRLGSGIVTVGKEAEPEEQVFKVGAATGRTWGTVKEVGLLVRFPFESECIFLGDVFMVKALGDKNSSKVPEFSAPGDSGAVVWRETSDGIEALGLIVGGGALQPDPDEDPYPVSYACQLKAALEELNCSLAT